MAQSSVHGRGPDLAIVGSARSGTTFLAAQLAEHPSIDAGAVKEPNFFSREYGRVISGTKACMTLDGKGCTDSTRARPQPSPSFPRH